MARASGGIDSSVARRAAEPDFTTIVSPSQSARAEKFELSRARRTGGANRASPPILASGLELAPRLSRASATPVLKAVPLLGFGRLGRCGSSRAETAR